VLLADGFVVVVDLLLGLFALHVPVAVETVALTVVEIRFGGLLAVLPPFLHHAMHFAVLVRVFTGGLAVGVLVADEACVLLALVVRLFAVIQHFDVFVSEIDYGGLFFSTGDEAERAEQEGEELFHAGRVEMKRGFSTDTGYFCEIETGWQLSWTR
jgi:hypothetical protein